MTKLAKLLIASKTFLDQTNLTNRAELRRVIDECENKSSKSSEQLPQLSTYTEMVEQLMIAYADAHGNVPESKVYKIRQLQFRAQIAVSRNTAVELMGKAIDNGYNEFKSKLLAFLPEDAQIFLGREHSPTVYVKGNIPKIGKMKASEWDYDPVKNETRIWWD